MGYYTNYKLVTTGLDVSEEDLCSELIATTKYDWDEDLELYDVKWYDYDKHMKHISNQHPNTLFTLEGDGEEQGDMWKAYYKNGKVQRCDAIITFEDFDEAKLK